MVPVRRAGSARHEVGDQATWSIAEGSRGRRWREVVAGEGAVRHALLLETDPRGRFSHLELATPAGLLTLHPEADGTLHGNAVHADGIRHVVGLPWDAEGCVVVDGSPVALAAAANALRDVVPPGTSTTRTVLRIGSDLDLEVGPARVVRLEVDVWRIEGYAPIRVSAEGLPAMAGGADWPLEVDPAG